MIEEKLREMFLSFNRRPTKDQIDVYVSFLTSYGDRRVIDAIERMILSANELPSVRDLIRKVRDVGDPEAEGNYGKVKLDKLNKPYIQSYNPVVKQRVNQQVSEAMLMIDADYCPHLAKWQYYEPCTAKIPPCMLLVVGRIQVIDCTDKDMKNCFNNSIKGKKIKGFDD